MKSRGATLNPGAYDHHIRGLAHTVAPSAAVRLTAMLKGAVRLESMIVLYAALQME
jgi:hypothetical protein